MAVLSKILSRETIASIHPSFRGLTVFDSTSRRSFLRRASVGCLAAAGGASSLTSSRTFGGETKNEPLPSYLKTSLNAYSFSKMLNDEAKSRGSGTTLAKLVDFCAEQGFDGFDPTGYFFPGYPSVPADSYVNDLKRRAFHAGIGISGTGVRNNFTTADKAVRAAGVEHIKQWVEVAAR